MSTSKIVLKIVSISFSILMILLILLALSNLGNYFYDFGYRVFTEEPVSGEPGRDVEVRITDSMSDMEIGKLLEEKGLTRDGTLFFIQLKLSAYNNKLKNGVYTLNTSMDAREMMQIMSGSELTTEEAETR